MKHAYLIIAHNEFNILKELVALLDDKRNDIYIHIDKKVKYIPQLNCEYANLYVLTQKERLDVRWGHTSQIEVELLLYEIASKNNIYEYYHLISGVHLPLKNQNYIHNYFENCNQQEVLQIMPTNNEEISFKLKRYHLFVRNYMNPNNVIRIIYKLLWRTALYFEKCFNISRENNDKYLKAAQWASITDKAVRFLLNNKSDLLNEYHNTFCSDEYFLATSLYRHSDIFSIKDCPELLMVQFNRGNPITYTNEHYMELINSKCLFARKFSESHMDIVEKLYKKNVK